MVLYIVGLSWVLMSTCVFTPQKFHVSETVSGGELARLWCTLRIAAVHVSDAIKEEWPHQPSLSNSAKFLMSKRKPKSRKKLGARRLQTLANARLCAAATWESRRPLGWSAERSAERAADGCGMPTIHGSLATTMLLCACAHGGFAARALVAVGIPKTTRVETRLRDAHAGELHSFVICEGVVSSELKRQVQPSPWRSWWTSPTPRCATTPSCARAAAGQGTCTCATPTTRRAAA